MTGPPIDVAHFGARLLQDALAEATATYWRKRADDFERARSRPGDYHGTASPEQITEADARLTTQADACRHRADAALQDSDVLDLIVQAVLDDEEASS